jgi:hypothetical protein
MTTKSDIDRMLETLESFRDSVPAHVRQLLRLLVARCDELEQLVTDGPEDSRYIGPRNPAAWRIGESGSWSPTDEERRAGEQDAMDALADKREFHVGDMVQHMSDDGSMGAAKIIAVSMDLAWCFYAKADCHRVYYMENLRWLRE